MGWAGVGKGWLSWGWRPLRFDRARVESELDGGGELRDVRQQLVERSLRHAQLHAVRARVTQQPRQHEARDAGARLGTEAAARLDRDARRLPRGGQQRPAGPAAADEPRTAARLECRRSGSRQGRSADNSVLSRLAHHAVGRTLRLSESRVIFLKDQRSLSQTHK